MEHLGGLIHRMPLTAFTFLVGCMAISALPPLNGFVSEWLTFQAILLSPELPQWGLKFLVPAVGAMLALSAALAAACFVKAFGVTFLGRPRTTVAADAQRGRPLVARGDVHFRGPVSAHRNHPRPGHRHARAGRERAGGRAHAGAGRRRRGCRSSRSPRAAAPITGSWSSSSSPSRRSPRSRSSTALPRARCAAVRPGTAAFRTRARPRNTPPAASPSRSAASSARLFDAREDVEMPAPGDTAACAAHRQAARPRLGDALCSDRQRHLVRDREAQSPAVPVHPQLPQPRIRGAHRPAAWGVDMALIPDPRLRMVCHDGGEDIA